ncbi:MAG: DUF47 family protein [Alicyclobacillus sp.]|nr:DUF47 family protein [Alicyclobacillus sp.]
MSKRSQQLFAYLVDIAANVRACAAFFADGLTHLHDTEAFASEMKAFERKGDELTSGLVTLLNATYITPLEREDFLALAVKLDDIIDGLEACAVRFSVFQIQQVTPVMTEFARNIVQGSEEIYQAMDHLNARRLGNLREYTLRINQLEKAGDAVLRSALRALFNEGHHDVLDVVKLKEIYEILEAITDRCHDVADVLDSIVVKNA